MARGRRWGTALAAAALPAVLLSNPAPAHAEDVSCGEVVEDEPAVFSTSGNRMMAGMGLADAHEIATGRGVSIAVVGSGVPGNGWFGSRYAGEQTVAGGSELANPAALMSAGVAAGSWIAKKGRPGSSGDDAMGIAPAARLSSVKVYDTSEESDQTVTLTPGALAAGIRAARGADVILVTGSVFEDSPELRSAVAAAARSSVVVTTLGSRPLEDQPGFDDYGTPSSNEDVVSYPSAYDGVLTVAQEEPYDGALRSGAIDVVAPTVGALVPTENGSSCLLTDAPADVAALAAGEAAGLAALVRQAYPSATPAQVITRIEETASGVLDEANTSTGSGTIQLVEALTAELRISSDGALQQATEQVITAPPIEPPGPPADEFAPLRSSMLWWGVLAGGGLLLAMILRPLLRRR